MELAAPSTLGVAYQTATTRPEQAARQRLDPRNLSEAEIWIICQYGEREYRAGVVCYFLGKRQLNRLLHPKHYEYLEGAVVLCCPVCGYVVTAYRNRCAV